MALKKDSRRVSLAGMTAFSVNQGVDVQTLFSLAPCNDRWNEPGKRWRRLVSERARATVKAPAATTEKAVTRVRQPECVSSGASPYEQVIHLQRTIGNQAVQRLFESGVIQTKLKIGQPDDIYEQEADKVAEQVMRMPEKQHIADSSLRSIADSGQVSGVRKEDEAVRGKPACSFTKGPSCGEEELVQPKPLASRITPLVKRQVEEEEEILQTKETSNQNSKATPNLESQITQINNILRKYRMQYRFLEELAPTVSVSIYPGSKDDAQDASLYFDPNEPALGKFVPDVRAEIQTWGTPSLGYKTFIIRYRYYNWFITIGPAALSSSPDKFLATLYHEFVHMQQFKRLRDINLEWAQANKENYEWLTGISAWFVPPGMESILFRVIIPREEMELGTELLHEPRTRLSRESIAREGVNLTNRATQEVLARSQTFAQFFHQSQNVATESILDLVPVHHSTVTTEPTWAYDDADEAAKARAIDDIVNTLQSTQDIEVFKEQVLPLLEAAHRNQVTPTWFVPDLKVGLANIVSVPFEIIYGPTPIPFIQ